MIFHQPLNSSSNYNFNTALYTDTPWQPHFHKNLELIYILSGSVDCTVNGVHYTLNEGDFGLCLPFDIHSYSPKENTNYWVLVFSKDYIRYSANQLLKKAEGFPFRCDASVTEFVKKRLINNPEPTVLTLKSCLYALIEEYIKKVPLIEKKSNDGLTPHLIIEYFEKNFKNNISLSDLAKQFGYDYNYMSRYFHNTFNMSFTDFINVYRIENAIRLLEDTNESISTVALESGFQSIRSFNKSFKKNMDITPLQYRKASRN